MYNKPCTAPTIEDYGYSTMFKQIHVSGKSSIDSPLLNILINKNIFRITVTFQG